MINLRACDLNPFPLIIKLDILMTKQNIYVGRFPHKVCDGLRLYLLWWHPLKLGATDGYRWPYQCQRLALPKAGT